MVEDKYIMIRDTLLRSIARGSIEIYLELYLLQLFETEEVLSKEIMMGQQQKMGREFGAEIPLEVNSTNLSVDGVTLC